MSMKKILLTAVAVSALSAGVSNAATISAAQINAVTLTVDDLTTLTVDERTSYALSNAVITAVGLSPVAANITTTSHTVTGGLTAGVFEPNVGGTTYSFTYALTGTASPTFSSAVTAFTLGGAGVGCTPTGLNIVSGGAVGTSSVTGVFNVPNTCTTLTAPNTVIIGAAPFKIAAAGTVVGTMSYQLAATSTNFDGAGASQTLVISATPYTVSVTADAVPTSMALVNGTKPVYTKLIPNGAYNGVTYDNVLGKTKFAAATAPTTAQGAVVYAGMQSQALPVISADVVVAATNNNFAVIKPSLNAVAMTLATPSASSATSAAVATGDLPVTVAISAANTTTVGIPTTYTATVTPSLATNTTTATPAVVTGALQSIGIEGTSFVAPWVGGSQSAAGTTIRLSNSGSATGAVTLSLLSPTYSAGTTAGASTCTSTTNASLASVPTNGELVIDQDALATCFGPFKRGDVLVTVQAVKASLTAKARNVSATGNVSEMSLGGLDVANISY